MKCTFSGATFTRYFSSHYQRLLLVKLTSEFARVCIHDLTTKSYLFILPVRNFLPILVIVKKTHSISRCVFVNQQNTDNSWSDTSSKFWYNLFSEHWDVVSVVIPKLSQIKPISNRPKQIHKLCSLKYSSNTTLFKKERYHNMPKCQTSPPDTHLYSYTSVQHCSLSMTNQSLEVLELGNVSADDTSNKSNNRKY